MTDNWGFYERRSESDQLRVLVNIGYKGAAPLAEYSELFSVTINLYPVRTHNHSKRDFIKQLEQFESSLEQWLKKDAGAIYVGRINAATRLEFYYYVSSGRLNEELIRQWMDKHWAYRVQHYLKPDPEWSFYLFMLPDQLEELFVHNAQMIYALIHKGDDIKQPRHVYHWLLFQEDNQRREVESTLQTLGYRIEKEKEGSPENGYPYPLVISRFDDVKLDTVNERVRELYRLIIGKGGRYDGWGSVMKLSSGNRMRQQVRRFFDSIESSLRKKFSSRNRS
ncbi:hypothetical protein Back11_29690 [Paenibacillus baekrokdamisoli]|uniref:Uncharacterized protein n=1 Tax=Paenibacillus baekrokdamisoli TaxID=1712516 RepID=A0A3G9JEK5_9BACL|nr:DUF695 domain-containing protein [Paenibacillus baekrokdamisoli]MBB3071205.1 regulator of RNase E activity RraB [Paenibacillus baekrokdamisoli]BBH21624.1 hypothetical protein Back11_29690 [Paenibacillus baekrokdamisoli]